MKCKGAISWEKSRDYLVWLCHGQTVRCTCKNATLEVKRLPSYFEVNVNDKFKLLLTSASNEVLFLRKFSWVITHPEIVRDVLADGLSVDEKQALQFIEQALIDRRLTSTEREYFMTGLLKNRLCLMLPNSFMCRTLESGVKLNIIRVEMRLKVENNAGLMLMLPAYETVEAVLADVMYHPLKCSRMKAMYLVQNAIRCVYRGKDFTKRVEKGDDATAAFAESFLTGTNPFILKLFQPVRAST